LEERVQPSIFIVSNTADSGAGSLRQAILDANSAGGSNSIEFASGVTGTISLSSALPMLSSNIAMQGPGANNLTVTRSSTAATNFGFLNVPSGSIVSVGGLTFSQGTDTAIFNSGTLTLSGVAILNNSANGGTGFGDPGGIGNTGALTVQNSTIAGNSTVNTLVAAGIDSEGGSVTIDDSTISGNIDNNSNSAGGVGIYGGTAVISHSTITLNRATGPSASGGGIDAFGSTASGPSPVQLFDTIVANNTGAPNNQGADVAGTFASQGHNLIGLNGSPGATGFVATDMVGNLSSGPINPQLGALQNNGGPTPTHALLAGSPAIDAADNTNAPTTDQRGFVRIINGTIDIGAFEFGSLSSLIVTTQQDETSNTDGLTSLREAILYANSNPGTDTITFNIPGFGVQTIQVTSPLPTITDPVVIDGYTQPGASPNTLATGDNAVILIQLNGSLATSGGVNGLLIQAGGSTVRGLDITGFSGSGILMQLGDGNTVAGNFVGTDPTGTIAMPNAGPGGIAVFDSSNNTIGGLAPADRNLVSGNTGVGIDIEKVNAASVSGNLVENNYVGTNAAGTAALGNGGNGVRLNNAANNTIGGSAGAGNLISGNTGDGIDFENAADFNTVVGNLIGTDVSGTAPLGNGQNGVKINHATNVTVGGTNATARNIISANASGVLITGTGAINNVVEGNFIGTDITGNAPLGNLDIGVGINSTSNNTVGGTAAGAGNVISGNLGGSQLGGLLPGGGVGIFGSVTPATNNVVEGNLIGTNAAGTAPLGNGNVGVGIFGAANNNTIGGTAAGAGNVISATVFAAQGGGDGVLIMPVTVPGLGAFTPGSNVVQGNLIGTNAAGTAPLGNSNDGVHINLATATTIGGTSAAARNVISGNQFNGVEIDGSGAILEGNFIGTDSTGAVALGNASNGVLLSGVTNTTVGGTAAGAGNLISGNSIGVLVAVGTNDQIEGNLIGTDVTGMAAVPNTSDGVFISGATSIQIGGTSAAARNIISGNNGPGVQIDGSNNVVEGNYIGTVITGASALANKGGGVVIQDSSNNVVGGTTAGAGNVISGNQNYGVAIRAIDGSPLNNLVEGNFIGTDPAGMTAIANTTGGVIVSDAPGTVIGGTTAAARNIVSGNGAGGGVQINNQIDTATGVLVEGNYIGTDVSGAIALGNTGPGITLAASNVTVGGTTAGSGNVVSGNTAGGIFIGLSGRRLPTSGNVVEGNFIGTDATGVAPLGNGMAGVGVGISITGSSNNTIGGTSPGARNLISANPFDIGLAPASLSEGFADTSNNLIQGNFIGTDVTGSKLVGTSLSGISISGVTNNTIGGTSAAARNIIAGGTQGGVSASGNAMTLGTASGTLIEGNYIGTDVSGTIALGPTGGVGVQLTAGAQGVTIGGTAAGAGNVISGNASDGVFLSSLLATLTTNNLIEGNLIGTDASGTAALANGNDGVHFDSAPANTIGGTSAAARNVISGNTGFGVEIANGSANPLVQGNFIGVDVTGAKALGNHVGVVIADPNITIGGTAAGAGNVISGNINGIEINAKASSTTIQGNFIGTDSTGTAGLGNTDAGVLVTDSNGNAIGGTSPGAGNVISGNGQAGVALAGTSTSNQVQGNLIGTDNTGTKALGNGLAGVDIGSPGNTVGGTSAAARNIIAGNGEGVAIHDPAATGNLVEGNFIGTDITGAKALGNSTGVTVNNAPSNTIGGTAAGAGNLISGNKGNGILVQGTGAGNQVLGNLIGTNAAGLAALGNTNIGVFLGSSGTTVGGTTAAARNVIAANGAAGVQIDGTTATGNSVQGNFIGVNQNGAALGNGGDGVAIVDNSDSPSSPNNVSANTIGGTTAGAGNVIAANQGNGVLIEGPGAAMNLVQGNFVGTDAASSSGLGNQSDGVALVACTGNVIGGTTASARNVVSGNGDGVTFSSNATANLVQGNFIGTNVSGSAALGNGGDGVLLDSSSGNTIGGTTAGAGNVISGNQLNGVEFLTGSSNNLIQGNFIGTDTTGTKALGNAGRGVYVNGSPGNTIGGTTAGAGNVISGNGSDGINLFLPATINTLVQGNFIGTDVSGSHALGNTIRGIEIQQAVGNTVGGTSSAARNIISGNLLDGISIIGASGNLVQGNLIGTQGDGASALGNAGSGVILQGNSSNNTIGGVAAGAGNTIAFNAHNGVTVDTGTGDLIRTNAIFSNSALGIDLGNDGLTPNHPGGSTTGPNNFQNFPVIAAAQLLGSTTTILGTLNSTPGQAFTVEFFVNDTADPSGFGQGKRPMGTTTVNTDPTTGNGSFSFTVSAALSTTQFITATATDAKNDTSEFSADVQISVGSSIVAFPSSVCGAEGVSLVNVVVATFQDRGAGTVGTVLPPSQPASSYTATIDWGDGTSPVPGTVTTATQGFTVTGNHTYGSEGNYNIHVTIQRIDVGMTSVITPATIGGFVTQLYHDLLRRAPDPFGLGFWVGVEHQGMARSDIANTFWLSSEHVRVELGDLYLEILHRTIDSPGMAFWEGQVAGGLDLTSVAIGLLTSPEYQSAHQTNQAYVMGLYQDLFGRPADPFGLQFWQAILDNHIRERDAVAFYFLSSLESFQVAIKEYYLLYLGRPVDAFSLQALTAAAASGQATPVSVASFILGSPEYLARALALAQVCTTMPPIPAG
jgi:hypothetical protein